MEREAVHDLGAAYALGALDDAERQAFHTHLESCERCREEAVVLAEAASALAYASEGPAPPEALRGRLLEAARAQRGAKVIPFPRFRQPVWIASLAAAACLAIGLGLWATIGTSNSPGRAQTVALSGRVGTLAVNGAGRATMAVQDLESLPGGAFYQVWVIPPGKQPIPDVRFRRGGRDLGVVLAREISPGDTVAVTIEHKRVSAPTGAPIISASIPA
jgi:anti-sigma-K factor RskA